MPKGDGSPMKIPETKPEVVSAHLQDVNRFMDLKPVDKSDTGLCKQRAKMFFDYCCSTGRLPTVELLCVMMGRSRETLLQWQRDENCENGRVIEQAKGIINAVLTEMAAFNELNSVYVIFQQKSNFHYTEPKSEVSVEVQPPQYSRAPLTEEEILAEFKGLLSDETLKEIGLDDDV